MMQLRTRTGSQDSGVIAIFLAAIIGILLLTSTTFAARVSTSELNQSSQVDQSEAAYYAAEAGVEEAIRRLVINPTATICQIFPEQFSTAIGYDQPYPGACPASTNQTGDYALLGNRANLDAPLTVATEDAAAASLPGSAWRYRKVTVEGNSFTGTQVKDESVQFDTSELCRRAAGGGVWGTTACDPLPANLNKDPLAGVSPIANSLRGLQYCWKANPGQRPDIEFTSVYWSDINNIKTEKFVIPFMFSSNHAFSSNLGFNVTTGGSAAQPAYDYCVQLNTAALGIVPGTKFIFRFKPLYTGVFGGINNTAQYHNSFSISYHAQLTDAWAPTTYPLYLPTNTFLIDVVGESGDIKRRIVAKVTRNGGILGIFDYLIYSGASGTDLCKPGIDQLDGVYNTNNCTATDINNLFP